ncbi:cadherin-7-like isoform X2 [Pollicipes pollicipes]|uniref:cadherin-7-like isoform X2 n=1 Tax=Pollicipes pollicipes TaxID=41117 RepID=UPI0018850BC7|nr:cadherin-7-like isoform X2 [Pollicipes pollicipes]
MAGGRAGVLCVLLAACLGYGYAACPDITTVIVNNWAEDKNGTMREVPAAGVTSITFVGNETNDQFDASQYVDATLNETSHQIVFSTLPSMDGVRDYNHSANINSMTGTCQMECGKDTGSFEFTAYVKDANTATPKFSLPTYTVHVPEMFPKGLALPNSAIFASDADAEPQNYAVSFSLDEDDTFGLSDPVKTSDVEPTYTAQLVLKKPLDWSKIKLYNLAVTAKDPDGRSDTATIKVVVDDIDNKQPDFDEMSYSTEVVDPEALGPLNVTIHATDPDAPHTLKYTMQDPSGAGWDSFFTLNPDTAEFSLTQSLKHHLNSTATAITFLLQATEVGGEGFYNRAALVVRLPAQEITTTPEPSTTTDMTSSSVITTTDSTPVTSPSSTDTTVTSSTTPATTPAPCLPLVFTKRQFPAAVEENVTGDVITLTTDPLAGDVTYFVRTPDFDDAFHLDENSGVLTKLKKLNHQRVSLLVQGVVSGQERKNQTKRHGRGRLG